MDIEQIRKLVSSEDTSMVDLLDAVEYLLKALDSQCPHGQDCACVISTRHEWFIAFCEERDKLAKYLDPTPVAAQCCDHPESEHETYEYRGDKPRYCLHDGCNCQRYWSTK